MIRFSIAIAGLIGGAIIAVGGPDEVEGVLFPVTSPTKMHVDGFSGDEFCWSIKFKKLRKASPIFFSWQVTMQDGTLVYLQQYRPKQSAISPSANYTTPKGFEGSYRNCAALPKGSSHTFTLRAFSRYRVWHRLWTVPRRLGPFSIINGKLMP